WGSMGVGRGGGAGGSGISVRGGTTAAPVDAEAWLRKALAPALQRCRIQSASLRLESTLDEVVDVDALSVVAAQGGQPAKARRCLEQAAWQLDLTSSFRRPHAVFALKLAR